MKIINVLLQAMRMSVSKSGLVPLVSVMTIARFDPATTSTWAAFGQMRPSPDGDELAAAPWVSRIPVVPGRVLGDDEALARVATVR